MLQLLIRLAIVQSTALILSYSKINISEIYFIEKNVDVFKVSLSGIS